MRTWVALLPAALSLSIAAGCSRSHHAPAPRAHALPPDQAAQVLINRNWLDRWPSAETDRLHVYRFTPSMGGGVFQDRTLFEGHFELFTYDLHGEHLTIHWPRTRSEDRVVYRIDEVSGPAPFDLRLELSSSSHGPRVYYGRSSETSSGASPSDAPGSMWLSSAP